MGVRILVCDDEAGLREMLSVLLRRAGYTVETTGAVSEAIERLKSTNKPMLDAVITDLVMPGGSGMEVLEAAKAHNPATEVVMITAYATTEQAVEAMRKGAYDYIQKPFKNHELLATLEKALEKGALIGENLRLRAEVRGAFRVGSLVGKSEAMRKVVDLAIRAAATTTNALITGESGTGKELVARVLHSHSDRADAPFIVLNCGALPETLIESELFGHDKGAFTGAVVAKDGLFRAAEGGTVFLDEIGELPKSLQVKLLRVLQERRVRPLGSQHEFAIDVRLIAATNRNLEHDVRDGHFRQDLFYRLNVIRIRIPPLRDRPEDVPLLAEHFVEKHCALQKRRLSIAPVALRKLSERSYPGNIRELENLIERAVALADGEQIEAHDIPGDAGTSPAMRRIALLGEGFDLDAHLAQVEKDLLLEALDHADGVRTKAAHLLGMTFRSFRYRLAKYGIEDADGPP